MEESTSRPQSPGWQAVACGWGAMRSGEFFPDAP